MFSHVRFSQNRRAKTDLSKSDLLIIHDNTPQVNRCFANFSRKFFESGTCPLTHFIYFESLNFLSLRTTWLSICPSAVQNQVLDNLFFLWYLVIRKHITSDGLWAVRCAFLFLLKLDTYCYVVIYSLHRAFQRRR